MAVGGREVAGREVVAGRGGCQRAKRGNGARVGLRAGTVRVLDQKPSPMKNEYLIHCRLSGKMIPAAPIAASNPANWEAMRAHWIRAAT